MKIIKDFDLYSPQWLEITFKGRNKAYGAYELRNDSSNRHIKAIIVVFAVGLLAVFLPNIVSKVDWGTQEDLGQDTEVRTTMIDQMNEEEQPKEELQVEYTPPPEIVRATVQVTQIVVAEKGEEIDPTLQKTDEELKNEQALFSNTTQTGSTEPEIDPEPEIVEKVPPTRFPAFKAEYPGGTQALQKYLAQSINYPSDAQELNIQGMVMVEFEVRADGSIGDVSILSQGGHGSLNREAIRVVKSMGKWKPARGESGNAIPSLFQVPIQFQLMQRPN